MHDLKFALGQLRKSPGFTLIAVITIALGIGATTAIFTVVDATLLEPLPYPHAEQLVSIQDDLPGLGARDVGMSQPDGEIYSILEFLNTFRQRGLTKII